jgi:hypothetical protein
VATLAADNRSFPSYVEDIGDMLRGTIVVEDYDGMAVIGPMIGFK